MDTKEILQKGSVFLRDCFRDAIDRHYEEEIALAVARQKENDVCCAIAAFLEMKTQENEMMRLLSKFYGVDSIAEAMELITTVKVTNQNNALIDYLGKLGMSRVEIASYLSEHRVRTQLQTELLKTWQEENKTCFFVTHDIEEAIVLASRVVIMSARPGRIKEIIDIDIPHPRDQATKMSPRFVELKNYIWSQVYQEYLEVQK